MNTNLTQPTETRTRRLLARMNATLFHGVGAVVLLESAQAAAAGDVRDATAVRESPEPAAGLRRYASSVWPEFGWAHACAAMERCAAPRDAHARAAMRAQVAALCRTLACIADDRELRDALAGLAAGAPHPAGEGHARPIAAPFAFLQRVRAFSQPAACRGSHVLRRAFDVLQQHWADVAPFAPVTYDEFLARAHAFVAPQPASGWLHRVVRGAWRRTTDRSATAQAATHSHGRPHSASPHASAAFALPPAARLR